MTDLTQFRIINEPSEVDIFDMSTLTDGEIAKLKAKKAAEKCDTAVIIEHVSLSFNAINSTFVGGFPGHQIDYHFKLSGSEGLYHILTSWNYALGKTDMTAVVRSTFAICRGKDIEPEIFGGECKGKIVTPQIGEYGFSWDCIF